MGGEAEKNNSRSVVYPIYEEEEEAEDNGLCAVIIHLCMSMLRH